MRTLPQGTVSRICDAQHGGQIVVSQTMVELVRDSRPPGTGGSPWCVGWPSRSHPR